MNGTSYTKISLHKSEVSGSDEGECYEYGLLRCYNASGE